MDHFPSFNWPIFDQVELFWVKWAQRFQIYEKSKPNLGIRLWPWLVFNLVRWFSALWELHSAKRTQHSLFRRSRQYVSDLASPSAIKQFRLYRQQPYSNYFGPNNSRPSDQAFTSYTRSPLALPTEHHRHRTSSWLFKKAHKLTTAFALLRGMLERWEHGQNSHEQRSHSHPSQLGRICGLTQTADQQVYPWPPQAVSQSDQYLFRFVQLHSLARTDQAHLR